MSVTGQPNSEPTRVGTSIGDITAGLFTAIGINAALYDRKKTGKGTYIDVSMLDCQIAILENAIARYLSKKEIPKPMGSRHPSIAPFEAFKTKEQWKPMTTGQLDISAFPLAYAAKFHPEFDITLMPGMVKNHKHALRVNASPMMTEIKKIINDAGVVVLSDAWLAGGFVSKKNCISSPESVKGQTFRALNV